MGFFSIYSTSPFFYTIYAWKRYKQEQERRTKLVEILARNLLQGY